MGSKTNAFETAFLTMVFNDTNIAGIGDGTGIVADGTNNLYVALYTASPGEAGYGTRASYGSYAHQTVARTAGGWTVSGNQVSNAGAITFPACSSGSESIVAVGVWSDATDYEKIMYYGTLDTPLSVSIGVQPSFAIGALIINED